ncbi:hypothetical protein OS493_011774 [Desmophyllum pertusum]|uniref:Uncharacterized protein n=1 Tax=Desmophyllum pertusum TaxID=174260 RepID=A0A9X0CFS8_9CNID|nr:hypothetical protein OS493_011774 [Desmophyllum pertusum]
MSLNSGTDGDGGRHGVPGPIVEIFTDVSNGYLNILTNGGNGKKGQNGQDGKPGVDRVGKAIIIKSSVALKTLRGQGVKQEGMVKMVDMLEKQGVREAAADGGSDVDFMNVLDVLRLQNPVIQMAGDHKQLKGQLEQMERTGKLRRRQVPTVK